MVAVIGKNWDATALFDDEDFVRIEVGQALAAGITVIPVLVDGVAMPTVDELPFELRDLTWRNGIELRRGHDTDMLLQALKPHLAPPGRRRAVTSGIATVVLMLGGLGFWIVLDAAPEPPPPDVVKEPPLTTQTGGGAEQPEANPPVSPSPAKPKKAPATAEQAAPVEVEVRVPELKCEPLVISAFDAVGEAIRLDPLHLPSKVSPMHGEKSLTLGNVECGEGYDVAPASAREHANLAVRFRVATPPDVAVRDSDDGVLVRWRYGIESAGFRVYRTARAADLGHPERWSEIATLESPVPGKDGWYRFADEGAPRCETVWYAVEATGSHHGAKERSQHASLVPSRRLPVPGRVRCAVTPSGPLVTWRIGEAGCGVTGYEVAVQSRGDWSVAEPGVDPLATSLTLSNWSVDRIQSIRVRVKGSGGLLGDPVEVPASLCD